MAKMSILAPFILFWEGGFVMDPDDKGGATNKGVTIGTFRQYFGKYQTVENLRDITEAQWNYIFKCGFWDKCKADDIRSQSVANLLVDWTYHSGPGVSIPRVQKILGVTADGIVGPKTLNAINTRDSRILFDKIKADREQFLRTRGNAWKYLNGWLNRLKSIQFGSLTYGGKMHQFIDMPAEFTRKSNL